MADVSMMDAIRSVAARERRERIATAVFAAVLGGDVVHGDELESEESARFAVKAADALIAALDAPVGHP